MTLQEIYHSLLQNIKDTRWQEWTSTIAQIVSVWYARKNNILVYPTGIIGVLLAAWIYFFIASPPLYADGLLNVYFFLMSLYGWYNWLQKNDAAHLAYPITWCTKRELLFGVLLFLISWGVLYFALVYYTDSNTPQLDSLVSSSSVTAMWWMAKRKVEHWLAWIFSNIIAIPLNFNKQFYLFSLMYILFLILAVLGYLEWKKKMRYA